MLSIVSLMVVASGSLWDFAGRGSVYSSRSKYLLYQVSQSLATRASSLALAFACSEVDAPGSMWSGVGFGMVRSESSLSCLLYGVGRLPRGPPRPLPRKDFSPYGRLPYIVAMIRVVFRI